MRLMLLLSLIALPVWAEDVAPLVKKVQTFTKKIDRLEKEIAQSDGMIQALEKSLEEQAQQQRLLERSLAEDVEGFNDMVRDLMRMARQPKEVQLMADMMDIRPQRQSVMRQGQKALQQELNDKQQRLDKLIVSYAESEQVRDDLVTARERKANQHKDVHALRKRYLADLAIHDEKLAKELAVATPGTVIKLPKKKKPSVANIKHRYALPVVGELVTDYNQKNEAGTRSKGLTIAAASDAKVQAVASGSVLYSGPFRTYGWLVIQQIAPETHAVYGGLARGQVAAGEDLVKDGTVGYLADADMPRLYMEIRRHGQAVNPKKWLMKK